MKTSPDKISKLVSYWLRHAPAEAGLVVDERGFVSINDLLGALASQDLIFNLSELKKLSASFDKIRWEIDDVHNRIRATHGHSFPVIMDEKELVPPDVLYHGTASRNVDIILEQGLLPLSRQFVHLSETIDLAAVIGARHGKPVILEVDARGLAQERWKFYKTSENVWLTSAIPSNYIVVKEFDEL